MPEVPVPWFAARGAWVETVSSWIRAELRGRDGVQLRSVQTVTERSWGATLRVATSSQPMVFKAVGPRGGHETQLLVDLAERCRGLTPEVVAVDHVRGWVLMADHGEPMASADVSGQVAVLEQLLPAYAEAQRTTADLVDDWLHAGLPDRTPRRLPALLEVLLAGGGRLGALPLVGEELDRLAGHAGAFARVCDELADGPLGPTVDHADIHGRNVLIGDDDVRLIDWGDACLGHPLSSLVVPVEWVAGRLDPSRRRDAVARLRRAYLEPWGQRADVQLLARAVWVGYVARAVSNDEQCGDGTPGDAAGARAEVVALLRTWDAKRSLLDDPDEMLLPRLWC